MKFIDTQLLIDSVQNGHRFLLLTKQYHRVYITFSIKINQEIKNIIRADIKNKEKKKKK